MKKKIITLIVAGVITLCQTLPISAENWLNIPHDGVLDNSISIDADSIVRIGTDLKVVRTRAIADSFILLSFEAYSRDGMYATVRIMHYDKSQQKWIFDTGFIKRPIWRNVQENSINTYIYNILWNI